MVQRGGEPPSKQALWPSLPQRASLCPDLQDASADAAVCPDQEDVAEKGVHYFMYYLLGLFNLIQKNPH